MKQFGKILRFELMGYLKNKLFVGITLVLVAAIVIGMFFPNIIALFSSDDETEPVQPTKRPIMLVKPSSESLESITFELFTKAFPSYDVKKAEGSEEEIQKEVTEGNADCAFVITDISSYTYYVDDLSMYDMNSEIARKRKEFHLDE